MPLIVDEVFTGLGRTGRMFAFEHAGLSPDILILGKSFGGGLPAAAIAGRSALLERWPDGAQSSTFQLHPVAAAAAAAFVRELRDGHVLEQVRVIEEWLRDGVEGLASGDIRATRVLGAFGVVEMQTPERARVVRNRALEQGLITWGCGKAGEAIGLVPPLVVAQAEVELAFGIMRTAIVNS